MAAEGGIIRLIANRLELCDGAVWQVVSPSPAPNAWWPLDEISGTDVAELYSPVANRGRAAGVTWLSGADCHLGGCASLDGTTNSYILLPAGVFNGLLDFTLSYWVKSMGQGTRFIFSLATGCSTNYILLYAPNDSDWSHFVLRRGPDGIHVFRDGVKHDEFLYGGTGCAVPGTTTAFSPGSTVHSANGAIVIGQDQDCIAGCFDETQAFIGAIDEVKLLEYAVSDGDIAANQL